MQSPHPVLAGMVVALVASTLSHLLPDAWAATGIGTVFLGSTYLLALRNNRSAVPTGLSLGGLLDPEPLSPRRLARRTTRAVAVSTVVMICIIPTYTAGFTLWFQPQEAFDLGRGLGLNTDGFPTKEMADLAMGHLLVVAFPEEAFFRGYLQSALEQRWPPRFRFLGGGLGVGVLLTSALFAVGHFATLPDPSRLAVFFPSLLFGWLRNLTGGIGASVLTHAACNLLVVVLLQGYGLG